MGVCCGAGAVDSTSLMGPTKGGFMSARTGVAVLVVACFALPVRAFAQNPGGDTGKWEIEVHAGGLRIGKPSGATTAIPAPGESYTTANNRPSRYVSSWYFGDGA